MHDEHLIEEPTTRAGFVKRLAKTAAIGLGIALVPATTASAVQFKCCRDTSCDVFSQCGQFGLWGYRCPSNPCASCCACYGSPSLPCQVFNNTCPC
jgi:hypothetical protein